MTRSKSTASAIGALTTLAWLALTSPAAAKSPVQPRDDETLEWLSDYREALALSKETERPLLVEFRCAP